MRRITLTVDLHELRELHAAVRDVPWLPLAPERYRAARSLARKVGDALAEAERKGGRPPPTV